MAMHLTTVPFCRLAVVFALLGVASSGTGLPKKAEPSRRTPIAFSGHVESVDLKLQTVAIKHGPIRGYMPAMTMDYPIDNKALLRKLKPDDKITATVYVGDPTLHDVSVVGGNPDNKHR
jgi:Cu/Ag efflux protein CusF